MSHMSISQALILFAVSKGVFGVYIGSIFVVNHTGMAILDETNEIDYFLTQIITARNIKSHPLTDFIMGGLNAQIEHHLFPQIPRPGLKQARNIVKDFCKDYQISYHEVGFLESFQEILTYLNSMISLGETKSIGSKVNMEVKGG
jgi:fatty acid desaturase